MSISSINGTSSYSIYQLYSKLSSGKRINSAADDAAGLAIAKKMQAQSTSYQTDNRNITDSQSLLNTAGGALSSVTDSLQRMRDLALQSSSGIYSDSDKQTMQSEIDQLKQQINSVSQGTQFNGRQILDGSQLELSGASQAQSYNSATDSLGISDFDVTGDFDIGVIDQALERVSSMQGDIGGNSNAMSHTMNYNSAADINIQSAQSAIEDADMERTIMELKNSQIVQKAGLFTRRHVMTQMQDESTNNLVNIRA